MEKQQTRAVAFSVAVLISLVSSFQAKALSDPTPEVLKDRISRALKNKGGLKTLHTSLHEEFGSAAIKPLVALIKNEGNNDEIRWAAVYGLGRLAGKESIGFLGKVITDKSWMLRDAALKTAAALGADELSTSITQRLKDEALVVRTTAVQTIGHLNLKKAAPKLVDALFDPINYNGGKGLWIHKYILQVIRDFKYTAATPKLVDLLETTKDETLQRQLILTLEVLTGKTFPNRTIQEQVFLWKRNTLAEKTF
ncbi:MAG: HEAT repeat domain-containing protein [Bdellovibrionota bacterium]